MEESKVKKTLPLLLVISLVLLLCACGDNGEEGFKNFGEFINEAESISFTATLRAEYSDKTANFKLSYLQNDEGIRVTVMEPELISGISAHMTDDSARLEYDGAILDIGTLSDTGLCPMSALPITVMAMKNAYLDKVWTEDGMTVARLIPSDDTEITLWLNDELIPCNAEISCNGKTVVFITFSDWEMN